MHNLVSGVDVVAATDTDSIWHRDETLLDGRLVHVAPSVGDNEGTLLKMMGVVMPDNNDNDVMATVPVFADMTELLGEGFDRVMIETHKATASRKGRVLGVVGKEYVPLSLALNMQVWGLALVRAGGAPETLGTCNAGRKYFASFAVIEKWKVPGDHSWTRAHFNILGDHGGGEGVRGSFATLREYCENTCFMFEREHMAMSAEERTRNGWVLIRHTKNAEDRMKDAVLWIRDGRARAESEKALMARLASKVISRKEVDTFIDHYISIPKDATKATTTRRERNRDAFFNVLNDVDDLGNHSLQRDGISGFGLLQAVSRFEDWESMVRTTKEVSVGTRRAFRAFTGEREIEKATARDRIMELTGVLK